MANVTKPPILDGTGQVIKQKLSDILAALQSSGGSYIPLSQKGAASGVAELDANGKVPSSQLPSYVDDVLEYASLSDFPATGESGKIYIAVDTNKSYRWSGSTYVEISSSLALGETSSTAYRGDRGKTAYDHATESGKISAAVASGLYKIAATAQGHIASLTAVQKSDLTALGVADADDIPTVNNSTITIKKNGTTVDSFTLNQSSAKDIDISVPTKTSQLTNDSGYITSYTDEKVTAEDANPSSDKGYLALCVPALSATTNQKPKAPSGYMLSIKNGTSSAVGHAIIRLGNSTASGSSNNKCGKIRLYSQKTKYVDLVTTADMTTADRTITLPDKDGTLALTSDIPTKTSDLTNDSGFVTTDEKVTGQEQNPSSDKSYFVTFIASSGNQKPYINNGIKFSTKEGTTSAKGYGQLYLGNNTPSGTAGNKFGSLVIYSEKNGTIDLRATASSTGNRNVTFPDKSGTVAMTSDLTTYAFAEGTNNGEIKITPSVGGTAGTAVTVKPKGISDLAYIAKGSGSSKFLREDGTWQTVTASWSGGQVASNIYPNATGTLKVGTISRYFSESYVRTAYVNTCVVGYEGEVTGSLYLSRAEGYSAIITAPVLSANVALTLPSASGTLVTDSYLNSNIVAIGIGNCPSSASTAITVNLPSGFTKANTFIVGLRIQRTINGSYMYYGDNGTMGTVYINTSGQIEFVPNASGVQYCAGQPVSAYIMKLNVN